MSVCSIASILERRSVLDDTQIQNLMTLNLLYTSASPAVHQQAGSTQDPIYTVDALPPTTGRLGGTQTVSLQERQRKRDL